MTRAERIVYKTELNLLDVLLTEIYQYTSPEGEVAFSIKPRLYQELKERLKKAESRLYKRNPSINVSETPIIPAWGPYDRELQYWSLVDFEIVGVNYRLQVENFLILLADRLYAEGKKEASSSKDKGKEKEDIRPPIAFSHPVSSTPHRQPRGPTHEPFRAQAPSVVSGILPPEPILRSSQQNPQQAVSFVPSAPPSISSVLRQPDAKPSNNPFQRRRSESPIDSPYTRNPRLSPFQESDYNDSDKTPSVHDMPQQGLQREESISRREVRDPRTGRSDWTHPNTRASGQLAYTDPRPSTLLPTFPNPPSHLYQPYQQPSYAGIGSMYGGVKDNTTSARLQQLLAPSRSNARMPANEPFSYGYPVGPPPDSMNWNARFPQQPPLPPIPPNRRGASAPAPGGGDEPDDSDDRNGRRPNQVPRIPGHRRRERRTQRETSEASSDTVRAPPEPRFDTKFRLDVIPTWNGNPDDLGRWIMKINRLAKQSQAMFEQLGALVPTRLEGTAERWYYSLSPDTRDRLEENWDSLRQGICEYFMNQTWMEGQKIKANSARYRESGHGKETPSEYFIRKLELLQLNFNYTDRELINQIMAGYPAHWTSILTPHLFYHVEQMQATVKFHEDLLIRMDPFRYGDNANNPNFQPRFNSQAPFNPFRNQKAMANLSESNTRSVGGLPRPQFPKDDSNVSRRATPESLNKRPCRHCGSAKHWDYECKYSRRGERAARTNFVSMSDEDLEDQAAYDEAYYALESDSEDFQ